jgi:putative CocE/NonD family hydrolase
MRRGGTVSADQSAPAPRFDTVTERDIRIPLGTGVLGGGGTQPGVTLSADLHRPDTDRPVPVLVTVQPYRKDFGGDGYATAADWFAARGYASLLVDLRGTGASDGVRRPEFDPGDADDAGAAIEWAATQPWCSGTAGAWGISYAANITFRVASRQSPRLRAIVALDHGLDPARDSVHPDGARGDLHALVNRGTSLLVQQLLPPLDGYDSPAAQERWRQRLDSAEPVFVDYARHGPGHPVWRERAIEGACVAVPTLCVGGSRDAFLDGLVDAYERIAGPKQLILGPWGHVMPHESAFAPIDFLPLALRWWDRWLGGRPVTAPASPVLLYLGGTTPRWRGYAQWPPAGDTLTFGSHGDAVLHPGPASARDGQPVGVYQPDASVGALRGLPGLGFGELTPALDQSDDDARSVSVTSAPLSAPLLLVGRPLLRVQLAAGQRVRRLVARLCAVDEAGASNLLTIGVVNEPGEGAGYDLALRPLAHRVDAGTRLRIALGDADFPRLNPLADAEPFTVLAVELALPQVPESAGVPVDLPVADRPPAPGSTPESAVQWSVERDPDSDELRVDFRADSGAQVSPHGYEHRTDSQLRAMVRPTQPAGAVLSGQHSARLRLASGEEVAAYAAVRCTGSALWAHGEVSVAGMRIHSRTWRLPLSTGTPPAQAAGPGDDLPATGRAGASASQSPVG